MMLVVVIFIYVYMSVYVCVCICSCMIAMSTQLPASDISATFLTVNTFLAKCPVRGQCL